MRNVYTKIIKKNILFPCSEYKVDPEKWGILCSILPDSLVFRNFKERPLGSISPDIPLLADRAIKRPSSTDL